jgi:hypothetical protein
VNRGEHNPPAEINRQDVGFVVIDGRQDALAWCYRPLGNAVRPA